MDGQFRVGPCCFARDEAENRATHALHGLSWSGQPDSFEAWLDACAGEVDMVSLLTPSTDHARQIVQLIDRGIPFLTEKPVACSPAEVSAIRDALGRHPEVFARFVHNYSAYPLFRELVLRLEEGRIGKVHHVRLNMPSDGFARERIVGKPQIWRQSDPEVPMIMLDLGTHLHHLERMLIGPSPARLKARMHKMVNTLGVIDNVEIWVERADGIRVSYWMSKAHLGIKNGLSVEVYGSDGALSWCQMDPDHLIETDLGSNRTTVNRGAIRPEAARRDRFKAGHPTGFVDAFGSFYADLAEDFRAAQHGTEGSRWICPMEQAFDGIAFLTAAVRASETDGWVDL